MAIEVPNMTAMSEQRKQLTPKTGYNVVGIDWFDHSCYLIDHCKTLAEAEKLKAEKTRWKWASKPSTNTKPYIYL